MSSIMPVAIDDDAALPVVARNSLGLTLLQKNPNNSPETESKRSDCDRLEIKSKIIKRSSGRNHQNDNFIIFNFFEVIQPPPKFSTFKDGFNHVARVVVCHPQFIEGMLLRDVTVKGKFPYLNYTVFDLKGENFEHDPRMIEAIIEGHGNVQIHHQAAFSELYTSGIPSIGRTPKFSTNGMNNMAYIVIVFKAEGNFDRFDETWQKWSGAEFIQRHLSKELKIGRMVLHKRRVPYGTFMYVLLCEMINGLQYVESLLNLVGRLNDRSCGYASLYVIDQLF